MIYFPLNSTTITILMFYLHLNFQRLSILLHGIDYHNQREAYVGYKNKVLVGSRGNTVNAHIIW